MESAPKDGTCILVATCVDDGEYLGHVVMWWADCWAALGTMKIISASGIPVSMVPLDDAPTHWLPLPPAPTGEV